MSNWSGSSSNLGEWQRDDARRSCELPEVRMSTSCEVEERRLQAEREAAERDRKFIDSLREPKGELFSFNDASGRTLWSYRVWSIFTPRIGERDIPDVSAGFFSREFCEEKLANRMAEELELLRELREGNEKRNDVSLST